METSINRLKEALRNSERVAVLTGAGVSAEKCQVMLVIGTSSVVQPAASLAYTAKSGGAPVAEINLERTPNSDLMDIVLTGKAGEILPGLVEGWA
ncbi:MAG: hypothetical protein K9N21_16740 [Deltaproteobacteria bacterium]|nr:hypothetical protein [Deltaproteobacteria bacterium]